MPRGLGPADLTIPGLGAGLLPKPLPGGLLTKVSGWCVGRDGSGEGVYACVHEQEEWRMGETWYLSLREQE